MDVIYICWEVEKKMKLVIIQKKTDWNVSSALEKNEQTEKKTWKFESASNKFTFKIRTLSNFIVWFDLIIEITFNKE